MGNIPLFRRANELLLTRQTVTHLSENLTSITDRIIVNDSFMKVTYFLFLKIGSDVARLNECRS